GLLAFLVVSHLAIRVFQPFDRNVVEALTTLLLEGAGSELMKLLDVDGLSGRELAAQAHAFGFVIQSFLGDRRALGFVFGNPSELAAGPGILLLAKQFVRLGEIAVDLGGRRVLIGIAARNRRVMRRAVKPTAQFAAQAACLDRRQCRYAKQ